ncbi:hypothetical protein TNCV_4674951 [Trichonephila clavipes]|nr:hypothetical protein TNCV_4674951 [Trichonephila clavipes]
MRQFLHTEDFTEERGGRWLSEHHWKEGGINGRKGELQCSTIELESTLNQPGVTFVISWRPTSRAPIDLRLSPLSHKVPRAEIILRSDSFRNLHDPGAPALFINRPTSQARALELLRQWVLRRNRAETRLLVLEKLNKGLNAYSMPFFKQMTFLMVNQEEETGNIGLKIEDWGKRREISRPEFINSSLFSRNGWEKSEMKQKQRFFVGSSVAEELDFENKIISVSNVLTVMIANDIYEIEAYF